MCTKQANTTFSHSLCIITTAMITSFQELLKLSDEQLEAFTADFESVAEISSKVSSL